MVEIAVENAPVGSALRLLLAAARFSCTSDPRVTGVVSYSSVGNPKPFWEVLGRVIGASPAPGVHVAPFWDSYRVLPRDLRLGRLRDYNPPPIPEPIPVPLAEGQTTHRMVGFVSLTHNEQESAEVAALLETRIPGVPSRWQMVRVGDSLQRKSPEEVARETDPAANVDVSVAVTEVAADHVTLHGGGDKSLRVPLSDTGVTDVFGFSSNTPPAKTGDGFDATHDPRTPNDGN